MLTSKKTQINVTRFVQSIGLLIILMLLAAGYLGSRSIASNQFEDEAIIFIVVYFVAALVYPFIAGLILTRQPRHMVGWLFLIVGFFAALGVFGDSLRVQETPIFDAQIIVLFHWMGKWFWIPIFFIPLTLVLQYFPDGRLPSPRWWPLLVVTILGLSGLIVEDAFLPWTSEEVTIYGGFNPFGIEGIEPFITWFNNLPLILIAIIGSMAAVVVRFRQSQGIEHIQMKWLVFTAASGIPLILLTGSNPRIPEYINSGIFASFPILLAVAIGIAILRHQLFDIDIIIRRTLSYAVLTGILAGIYFGGVVGFQSIFRGLTGNPDSPLITVISTLTIAALFNPLRIRIQDFIDRRFFRAKYDAEQTLAEFAVMARDEVDMDRLTGALLSVVEETMQPETTSLWISGK